MPPRSSSKSSARCSALRCWLSRTFGSAPCSRSSFTRVVLGSSLPWLPWGKAKRRVEEHATRNYSLDSLASLECDSEDTTRLLQEPSAAAWCRGCDVPEAFELLQWMTAAQPYAAKNWHALGIWIGLLGNPVLAMACFAIVKRLLHLQGLPLEPTVEASVAELRLFYGIAGPEPDPSALWQEGGWQVGNVILKALETSPVQVPLLNGHLLLRFTNFLANGL